MRYIGRIILLITLLSAGFMPALSKVWKAGDVPMVYLSDSTQYVCDPEELLSRAARDSSNVYLQRLNNRCGVQSVFVIVRRIEGGDAFRMAQDIGNRYGVGRKSTRRGLVIVIAVDDHRYFIAPGQGLEEELTDLECGRIGRNCIARNMSSGDVDEAVLSTCRAIYGKLSADGSAANGEPASDKMSAEDWFLLFFLTVMFFGIPLYHFIYWLLEIFGLVKPRPRESGNRRNDDDFFPPFIFGGGGGFGSGRGFGGGSFGGGSFGGGGAGGGW